MLNGERVAQLATAAVMLWLAAVAFARSAGEASPEQIERGRYLTVVGGCGDCHSPKIFTQMGPVEDSTRLLSGHPAGETLPAVPADVIGPNGWGFVGNAGLTAFYGPWGTSYAANLTSDEKTGVGAWTEDQFIKAMRTGKHRGFGRPILPPMPWVNLTRATDEDLKAILAYFKSTKPVGNEVPQPVPPSEGAPIGQH